MKWGYRVKNRRSNSTSIDTETWRKVCKRRWPCRSRGLSKSNPRCRHWLRLKKIVRMLSIRCKKCRTNSTWSNPKIKNKKSWLKIYSNASKKENRNLAKLSGPSSISPRETRISSKKMNSSGEKSNSSPQATEIQIRKSNFIWKSRRKIINSGKIISSCRRNYRKSYREMQVCHQWIRNLKR